ncbi:hypothetical protein DUI87_08072 [Hirundo rustica rustica]|uniref:Uncharacterized protein n=1 Tax=Hirundo rustica rustica TaxID=333673 RepID=A0A3M0L9E4_HIRRU|nr:hypothetical protein DUI87_08072 [Hirundo rustica rustica]
MEAHGGEEIHLQPLKEVPDQEDTWWRLLPHRKVVLEQAPGRMCRLMERGVCAGAGLLAGLVMLQRTHSGELFLRSYTLWKETHVGVVHKELQSIGRTHVGKVHGGLSPVGGIPHWSRGRVGEFLP